MLPVCAFGLCQAARSSAALPGLQRELCARRSHLMSDKENALGLETEDVFKFYAFQRQNVSEAFPEFHKDTPSGKGGAKGLQVSALLLLLLA